MLELHLQVQSLLDVLDVERRIELDDLPGLESSARERSEHLRRDARLLDVRFTRELAGDDPERRPGPNEIGTAYAVRLERPDEIDLGIDEALRDTLAEGDVQAFETLEDEVATVIDPDLEAVVVEALPELIGALERLADAIYGRLPDLGVPGLVVPQPVDEPELEQVGIGPALELGAGLSTR